MTKRKARQLHAAALASYQRGYIEGTEALIRARADEDKSPQYRRFSVAPDSDATPAAAAGYELGRRGVQLQPDRLPLDVWVKVLARDAWPTRYGPGG